MRQGGGKAKGSQFERDTCKALSKWISDGKREDLLWRSAMSGGRATIQKKSGVVNLTQAGDISSIDPLSAEFINTFVVECKVYADLGIARGFLCRTNKLYEFWEKLKKDAYALGKLPFLIAKQNRYPTLAIVDGEGEVLLGMPYKPLVILPHWGAVVYNFDDLVSVSCFMGDH